MNRIKEVLVEQGRSQKWLAQKIGKSEIMVSNYCSNKAQPKLETIFEMAVVLHVAPTDLIKSNLDKLTCLKSQ